MPRIYEVPTHLNVEDTLLLGLTPRQLVRLAAFTSLAYGLWDQVTSIRQTTSWPVCHDRRRQPHRIGPTSRQLAVSSSDLQRWVVWMF
jgi:hypothetical protein